MSVLAFNQSGDQLGFLITIDKGTTTQRAVLAYHTAPPANFPLGYIVAGDDTTILYSGSNCTGTLYIQGADGSTKFRDVLYPIAGSDVLYRTIGSFANRTISSSKIGAVCQNGSTTVNAAPAELTPYSLNLDYPWDLAAF